MGLNQIIDEALKGRHVQYDNKFYDKSTEQVTKDHCANLLGQEVKDRLQASNYRKFFVWYVAIISAASFISLIILSIYQGFNINNFNLDTAKFVALVSFGGFHVFGLFAVVIKYLFSASRMPFTIIGKQNK